MRLKLLIGHLLLNCALVAYGQDKPADKVARVKFASDLAATTSKQVGHTVRVVTGGEQAEGFVLQDTAITAAEAGQGFFSKNVGVELAQLGFEKVFVTNGKEWWCDVPNADSDTGWWKPMGLGGPFKTGKEAADMLATLWPIYMTSKKAPVKKPAFVDPPLAPATQAGNSEAKNAPTNLDVAERSAKIVAEERVPPQQFAAIMQKAAEARAKADLPEDLRTAGLALGDALKLYPKVLKSVSKSTGSNDLASTRLAEIQGLSAKLGKDLVPKNADDVRSILAVYHDCRQFASGTDAYEVFARTHANLDTLAPRIQNYLLPQRDSVVGAIETAIRTMQETERSLDNGDYLTAANGFASLSSPPFSESVTETKEFAGLMTVVDEYLQRSSRLKEDLHAYAEASRINRASDLTMVRVASNVADELELLKSAQSQPLTKAFLENVIVSDSAELKKRINDLPPFAVKDSSYSLPSKFATTVPANAQQKAEFLKGKLSELDSKLASIADIKGIYAQPILAGVVAQQCGNDTMSGLNTRRAEINHAEAIRASLADDLKSVQAKIQQYDAEERARQAAAAQVRERREKEKQAAAFVDPPLAPANLAQDNPNGDAVFLVVSSSMVTIGNTDANGYRFNEGPKLQRVVGRFADGGTVDLLCFGAVLSRGLDGYTQHEGACPRLQVGKRYLMKIGRSALYYERPGGDSVNWQVLEVCSGVGKSDPYGMHVADGRGGRCQQVSTVNDR